jgi:hypothetical protein
MKYEEHGEYREYRVHHVVNDQLTTTVLREWLEPKTNKQRQDNLLVQRYRDKLEPILAGLKATQRRYRSRRLHKAFRIQQFKKQKREKKK